MKKEILRVRLTNNVKQLKKYVDEAISKGAEDVQFDMDKENPYFVFTCDLTPEQQIQYELEELEKYYNQKSKELRNLKYKTHTLRINQYVLSQDDIEAIVLRYERENGIEKSLPSKIKQVINSDYDDFKDSKETVFITEILH